MLINRINQLIYSLIIVLIGISCSGRKVAEPGPCARAGLGERLDSIIGSHEGVTGVAVLSGDSLLVTGDTSQLPLMSIFKMHIAVAVLDKRIAVDSIKKHNLPRKPSPYCAVSCSHYREDFGISQYIAPIEQPLSTEQTICSQRHKFYYHICEDIL